MKNYFLKNKKGGYTIIETMIAVSLFLIIVVAGVGALLNANVVHNKSANLRSVMDNLTFIMEDMSRHIRTGYNYRCYSDPLNWSQGEAGLPELNDPRFCANGGTIVFEEAYGDPETSGDPNTDDQWVYNISAPAPGQPFEIRKSSDGGQTFTRLNDTAVSIDPSSYFAVLGPEHPDVSLTSGDLQQPMVTIVLKGEINYKDVVTPFSLQTSVTQRLVDVTP